MTLLIRRPKTADIAALTDLYNHYIHTTTITFDIAPFTVEQRTQWFNHYRETGRHQLFIAELAGEVVGYASSSQLRSKAAYDTSVETSVYLNPKAHGQGIGTQLYHTLLSALATEDVHRAYAGITLPNPASIALHQKFGFKSVGVYREVGRKFGRYWDVEWFEKAL
ncbi:GNAT family N-acetyltransferase [Almyronema epifaneia]|uniref:GNAT family N-acetyltransferase n=1 Tax=Almyronema epifaneia S1 TaxID=2991925 RepID=A0ABW6IBP0_9CYAN